MTEKQKELLELLREVDAICRRHNLRYVMAGGSLIGVVRNRGFVPWDDDIDIYMPRDDWERFVQICKTEAPPDRTPIDIKIDRGSTNTFPRYGNTQGCVIHRHQLLSRDVAGEIIDVLTLDPIPPDEKSYLSYRENLMLYSDLVNPTSVYGPRYEVSPCRFIFLSLKKKLLGKEITYSALEKKMFSWKEEDCNRVAMRWGGCPFLFDKDMFYPTKDMPFEDMMVKVPARVSDYLIWHYGDEWAYVPAHEEREGHDTVNPPMISYEEFRNKYQPRIQVKTILRHSFLRKVFQMFVAKENHRADQRRKDLLSKAIAMDTKARISEAEAPLKELLKERRFEELSQLFNGYYTTQLSSHFVGREDFLNIEPFYHPTLIPLEDEQFFAALWTLLYTERIRWADRLLKIYVAQGGSSQEGETLRRVIDSYRAALNTYEQEGVAGAYASLLPLCSAYPENPSFEKFRLKLLYELWQAKEQGDKENPAKASQDNSSWKSLFQGCLESIARLCPEDGFVEKYEADLLRAEGHIPEAIALYKKAVEDTKNGITWLEIGDILQKIDPEAPARTYEEKAGKLLKGGYPKELIPYRLRLKEETEGGKIPTLTQEEVDLLEEKGARLEEPDFVRDCEAGENTKAETEPSLQAESDLLEKAKEAAEASFLLGEYYVARGKIREGFACFLRALSCPISWPGKETAERLILEDWYEGERRLRSYAPRTQVEDYLNGWLDKYGSYERLKATERILSTGGLSGEEAVPSDCLTKEDGSGKGGEEEC